MSNPWAVVQLFYDDEDLQLADFSIYFWVEVGLMETPQVRGEDTVVPNRAGRTEGNRRNDILTIVLNGQITSDPLEVTLADARASWRTKMLAMRTLFASNRSRAPLVAILEDGSSATIMARPLNIVVPNTIPGEYASVSVELEGDDDWAFTSS